MPLPRFVSFAEPAISRRANRPILTPAFLARFLSQLRSRRADFTPLLCLEQWIAEEGMSPDDAMR